MSCPSEIYLAEIPPNQRENAQSSSCPASVPMVYGFVILFNWNESLKKPFKMFPRQTFGNEIGDKCITSRLTNLYRIKKLKSLKSLPGQKTSLFAKVESGIEMCTRQTFITSVQVCFIV